MKKVATVFLLTMALAVLTVIPVFAATDEPQVTVVDGVEVASINYIAARYDIEVEWDAANQSIIITDSTDIVTLIAIHYVGGFNDGRTTWLPLAFATNFFYTTAQTTTSSQLVALEFEPNFASELLNREPLVRTTYHGELAVEIITEMNDNFYNRLAFTYRESEAAEWIADELLAMGFGEDAVAVQSFYIGDVEELLASFGNDWFVEAVNRRVNNEELVLEEFIASQAEAIYLQAIEEFTEMGVPYEMIAEVIGGELTEVIETYIIPSLGRMFDMYGIFSDEAAFRPYSQNVILTIPGQSEQKIVLTAHYDTIYNTPGASDNASGVALLMESAYNMLGADNYFTLVYVFAGAEEVGLIGTFYYYDSLSTTQQSNVLLNINADVLIEGPYFFIGAGQLDEGLVGLSRQEVMWYAMSGDGLVENAITDAAIQIARELNEEYGLQLIANRYLAAMPSDQLVFLINGHPVIALTGLARYGDEAYIGFNFDVSPMAFYDDLSFGGSFLHTLYDDVHFINETWSDKIANAMWTFSLLLEALLA